MAHALQLRRAVVAAVVTAPAGAARAAEAAAPNLSVGHFVQVFVALAAIVLLIFGLALAAQRLRLARGTSGRHLRVVDALALGARERLLLVEVAGECVLLAVAGGRVERIHVLADGIPAEQREPRPPSTPGFRGALAAALGARGDAA